MRTQPRQNPTTSEIWGINFKYSPLFFFIYHGGGELAKTKTRTRYRAVKKYVSKARSFGGGRLKPYLDGFLAGAGGQVASKWIGPWGHPAGAVLVGEFRHNNVLKVMGARELGAMIAGNFIGGGQTPGGFTPQG